MRNRNLRDSTHKFRKGMRMNNQIIERQEYLKRLIAKRENGLVKVITGVRRCGKSFLLFTLYKQYLIDSGVQ